MAAASTIDDFLDALRDELLSLADMAGVAICTGPVDDLTIGQEAVVFCVDRTDVAYDYLTAPGIEVSESYEVEGRIWIVKAGAGEAAICAARERALELLAAVHDLLNDHRLSPTDRATFAVDDARIVGYGLEQFALDGGRDARITFRIAVRARFTPE